MVFSASKAATCLTVPITLHQSPALDSPKRGPWKQFSHAAKVRNVRLPGLEMPWVSFPDYHHVGWPEVAQANSPSSICPLTQAGGSRWMAECSCGHHASQGQCAWQSVTAHGQSALLLQLPHHVLPPHTSAQGQIWRGYAQCWAHGQLLREQLTLWNVTPELALWYLLCAVTPCSVFYWHLRILEKHAVITVYYYNLRFWYVAYHKTPLKQFLVFSWRVAANDIICVWPSVGYGNTL